MAVTLLHSEVPHTAVTVPSEAPLLPRRALRCCGGFSPPVFAPLSSMSHGFLHLRTPCAQHTHLNPRSVFPLCCTHAHTHTYTHTHTHTHTHSHTQHTRSRVDLPTCRRSGAPANVVRRPTPRAVPHPGSCPSGGGQTPAQVRQAPPPQVPRRGSHCPVVVFFGGRRCRRCTRRRRPSGACAPQRRVDGVGATGPRRSRRRFQHVR